MSGFGRILSDLNEAGVRYVLAGGIAVIRHGYVRATTDVDAIVAHDDANLAAIKALVESWEATRPDGSPLPPGAVAAGRDLHLAIAHGEVDLLAPPEVSATFEDLLARSDTRKVDGADAPIVSLADLVGLKRRAGRPRDEDDLRELERAHGELPAPEGWDP